MRRLRIATKLFVSIILITVIGCGLENPGLPTWSIEATIPFSQQTYHLSELITDSSTLEEQGWGILGGEDAILRFEYRDTLDYQNLSGQITFEESARRTYRNNLHVVIIEGIPPDSELVNIVDVMPDSIRPGYNGTIPPTIFPSVPLSLEFSTFEWAEVQIGYFKISVKNNFPFSVNNLIFTIQTADDGVTIGTIQNVATIMPGETVSDSTILSDIFLINDIRILVNGSTIGTSSDVLILDTDVLEITALISTLTTQRAFSEFGTQSFSAPDSHDVDNRNRVIEAVIKKGSMYVQTSNTVPSRVTTTTIIENMVNGKGRVPTLELVMEPGTIDFPSEDINVVNLAGYKIAMKLDDQRLYINNSSISEDTRITRYRNNTYQYMSNQHGIAIEYWTSDLEFKSFTGILDSVRVEIPVTDRLIDLPEGLDSVQFIQGPLILNLHNESELDLLLNLQIIGVNTESYPYRSVNIPVDDIIHPGLNRILIPEGYQLFSISPDSIHIEGNAFAGGLYFPEQIDRVVSITERNGFYGDFSLGANLEFVIGSMSVLSDPVRLEESFDAPVESILLTVDVVSSIPLSGSVSFLVGTDTTAMDTILTAPIPHGLISDHRAESIDTSLVLFIGEDKLDAIMQDSIYTRQVLNLNSSDGDTVWLYGSDSLRVSATALVRYLVDIYNDGNDETSP